MDRIITIGREFGSGGKELARLLSQKLGIAYYDNEIITAIAKKTELAEDYVKQIVEKKPNVFFPVTVGKTLYLGQHQLLWQSNLVYAEQSNIIKEMATKSSCVIVGRCADYILKEFNPYRIFVYADMDARIERCKIKGFQEGELASKAIKKQIIKVDKNRAGYYRFYTGQKWGDRLNYDLCVNTSSADIEKIADLIVKMLQD